VVMAASPLKCFGVYSGRLATIIAVATKSKDVVSASVMRRGRGAEAPLRFEHSARILDAWRALLRLSRTEYRATRTRKGSMTISSLERMYAHMAWANQRVLDLLAGE